MMQNMAVMRMRKRLSIMVRLRLLTMVTDATGRGVSPNLVRGSNPDKHGRNMYRGNPFWRSRGNTNTTLARTGGPTWPDRPTRMTTKIPWPLMMA